MTNKTKPRGSGSRSGPGPGSGPRPKNGGTPGHPAFILATRNAFTPELVGVRDKESRKGVPEPRAKAIPKDPLSPKSPKTPKAGQFFSMFPGKKNTFVPTEGVDTQKQAQHPKTSTGRAQASASGALGPASHSQAPESRPLPLRSAGTTRGREKDQPVFRRSSATQPTATGAAPGGGPGPAAPAAVAKRAVGTRVRPKSASAARRPDRAESGDHWNYRSGCDDWGLALADADAARQWGLTRAEAHDRATAYAAAAQRRQSYHRKATPAAGAPGRDAAAGGGAAAGVPKAVRAVAVERQTWTPSLSHRKPGVRSGPGQLCYGTNTRGVPLPRRPQSAAAGRENREPVRPSTDHGSRRPRSATRARSGASAGAAAAEEERPEEVPDDPTRRPEDQGRWLDRGAHGGWDGSTLLDGARTGYDTRTRYPQAYAAKDVAKLEAGRRRFAGGLAASLGPATHRAQGQAAWYPEWNTTTKSTAGQLASF